MLVNACETRWENGEQILDRFRSAWKSVRRPSLKGYLRHQHGRPDFSELAFELACLDLSRRLIAGDEAPVVELLLDVLAAEGISLGDEQLEELARLEYDRRWERSERGVVRDEYAARFAHLKHRIGSWRPRWDCPACPRERIELPDEADATATCPGCAGVHATDSLFHRVSGALDEGLDLRHYTLMEEIDIGGMGQVFRATDPALGRDLALKTIRSDLPMDQKAEAERRFLNESRLLGELQHPNIVPMHNVGRLPDGRLFFTMKLIKGQPLHRKIAGRDPGFRPLQVFEQVCQAIAFAHGRGVIHRDLKPSNVLVGEFGEVQVIDWGLAKRLGEGDHTGPSLMPPIGGQTQVGAILGTAWYMPAEQLRGEIDRIDKRSDVFALGATLCEMLTGCSPYLLTDEVTKERYDLGLARLLKADVSPGLERLEQPAIDARVAGLVRACLQKDREQRPNDAAELVRWLTDHQTQVDREAKDAEIAKAKGEAETKARLAAEEQQKAELKARLAAEQQQEAEMKARLAAENTAKAERQTAQWSLALAGVIFLGLAVALFAAFFFNRLAGEKQELADDKQELANDKQKLYESEQQALGKMTLTAAKNEMLAKEKSKLAKEKGLALEQSTDRLERQFVQEGARRLAVGDLLGSLPYFAEPLRIHAHAPDRQKVHRLRLAAVTRQAPRLLHVWAHDKEVKQAELSPDGRYVVTTSDDGYARLWDAASGKPVRTPWRHEERQVRREGAADNVFVAAPPVTSPPAQPDEKPRSPYEGMGAPPRRSADGRVYQAAFDRNARNVVTVSDLGSEWVRVWEVATGKPRTPYLKHPSLKTIYGSCQVCFSPDGTRVAACGSGQSVHVWEVASGKPVFDPLLESTSDVVIIRFSPDGNRLLAAGADGNVRLWEATTGKVLHTIAVSRSGLAIAEFSPDGRRVLTGSSSESAVVVSDVLSGKPLRQFGNRGNIKKATFSPDGRSIAVAGSDGTVRVWSTETGDEVGLPLSCDGQPEAIAFSPDGRWLAVADRDGVRVFDAQFSWEVGPRLVGTGHQVAFSPHGRDLLSISGKVVRLWRVAADDVPARDAVPGSSPRSAVAVSPDGRWLAVTRPLLKRSPHHLIVDRKTGIPAGVSQILQRQFQFTAVLAARNIWQLLPSLALRSDSDASFNETADADRAVFSPDGHLLVTFPAYGVGQVSVWDVATNRLLCSFRPSQLCYSAAMSPDGRLIACGHWGDTLTIREVASGKLVRSIALDPTQGSKDTRMDRACLHLEFSSCGKNLLTANGGWSIYSSLPSFVRLWDVATGKPVSPVIHPGVQVSHASLSPDGSFIATACAPTPAACVWDAKTGKAVTPPMRHRGPVHSARFSTDGRYLVTAGNWGINLLGAAQIWDPRKGEPITAPFRFPHTAVTADFDPKTGRVTVLVQGDSTGRAVAAEVWSWSLRPEQAKEEIIRRRIATLAAAKINDAGGYVEADFLAERLKLRAAEGQPPLATDEARAAWHDRQAAECEREKRWGSAVWHLERQIRLVNRPTWDLHYRCGRANANERRWNAALPHLTAAIRLDPPTVEPLQLRGEVNAALEHWDDAATDFLAVLGRVASKPGGKISPEETALHARLGFCYAGAKNETKQREQCELLMTRLWDNAVSSQIKAAAPLLLLSPNSVKNPKRLLALVQEFAKDNSGPRERFLLAVARYRTGDRAGAEQALNQVYQGNPDRTTQYGAGVFSVVLGCLKSADLERAEMVLKYNKQALGKHLGVTDAPQESRIGWMERSHLLALLDEAAQAIKACKAKK